MDTRRLRTTLLLLLLAATAFSQLFTYTARNLKPGDVIPFSYEPAGPPAGQPEEAAFYELGFNLRPLGADDLKLRRKGNKYTGTFSTDTAARFIYFSFSWAGRFDNNTGHGYGNVLSEGRKACPGTYFAQSFYVHYLGSQVGLEPDMEKACEALQKEMGLYPEDRKRYLYFSIDHDAKLSEEGKMVVIGSGSDDLLARELSAMIELVSEVGKQAEPAREQTGKIRKR